MARTRQTVLVVDDDSATRDGLAVLLESWGYQVALAADGSRVLALGDPDAAVFPRSSNKPMQAVGMLEAGLDLDGELPVNPDGGLKSFGHPIGASGLRMLFECWLQLRGLAGPRQIPSVAAGKTKALTHNLGGSPGACVSFVSIVGTELG